MAPHLGISARAQQGKLLDRFLPPVPAFHHHPRTIEDVIDHTAGKVLDQLQIEHDLVRRRRGT